MEQQKVFHHVFNKAVKDVILTLIQVLMNVYVYMQNNLLLLRLELEEQMGVIYTQHYILASLVLK